MFFTPNFSKTSATTMPITKLNPSMFFFLNFQYIDKQILHPKDVNHFFPYVPRPEYWYSVIQISPFFSALTLLMRY